MGDIWQFMTLELAGPFEETFFYLQFLFNISYLFNFYIYFGTVVIARRYWRI